MEAIEIWNRGWTFSLFTWNRPICVTVISCNEGDSNTWHSQEVKYGVQQFVCNTTATTAGSIHQHGLTHAVNKSHDHQNWVEIELLSGIFSPCEWMPGFWVISFVKHPNPVKD
jgi:hypothetical protein